MNHLGVPPMDLTISEAGDGKLRVELNVPRSSGSQDNIPFLEVTRNEQQTLLNGARQDMISRLSRSGFQIGDIQVQTGGEQSQHTGVSGAAIVPEAAGKLSFEISSDSKIHGSLSTVLRNNPDLAGATVSYTHLDVYKRQSPTRSRTRPDGPTTTSSSAPAAGMAGTTRPSPRSGARTTPAPRGRRM